MPYFPWQQLCQSFESVAPGESVYTVTDRSKKRKTADRKAAAAKAAEAAASVDPSEPWAVHNRQPWADKEVKPAELNDEQKAFMEQVSLTLKTAACPVRQDVACMLVWQALLSGVAATALEYLVCPDLLMCLHH